MTADCLSPSQVLFSTSGRGVRFFLGENRTHPHNIVELNTYIAFSSCTTKELKIAHLENLYILKEKKW